MVRAATCSLVAGLLLLVAAPVARAQNDGDLPGPVVSGLDERVRQFLSEVAAGDANHAFQSLLVRSQLINQEDALRSLVEKAETLTMRFGAYRESEQLAARRIGNDLVLMKYLFKCEDSPVIWYFAFYRETSRPGSTTDDPWVVISVRFDTAVERLLED